MARREKTPPLARTVIARSGVCDEAISFSGFPRSPNFRQSFDPPRRPLYHAREPARRKVMTWQPELDLAARASNAAAAFLREAFHRDKRVRAEEGRDIKLQADLDAESRILDVLRETGFAVLAEESGESGPLDGDAPVWVVDPLDGTMNFKHGIPLCCVSIALSVAGRPVLGVIEDFTRGECFRGIVGRAAWLNNEPMRVSDATDPARAILVTGFPTKFDVHGDALGLFMQNARRFKKVRMLGSAALMMAYVAAGRVDAYAEDDIMYWDIAAGAALVEAAGGWADVQPAQAGKWARRVRCAASPSIWRTA
jgi:myo-inositol-1(or 4)-monophosphatase